MVEVQNCDLAVCGDGEGQNPGGQIIAAEGLRVGALVSDIQAKGQLIGELFLRQLPECRSGMGDAAVKGGGKRIIEQKDGGIGANGIVGETG